MKRAKMMVLALTLGTVAQFFGGIGCGRFWGDFFGDIWVLNVVDNF